MENQTIEEKQERLQDVLWAIHSSYGHIKTSNTKIGRLQEEIHRAFEYIEELEKEQGKLRKEIRELKKLKEENS